EAAFGHVRPAYAEARSSALLVSEKAPGGGEPHEVERRVRVELAQDARPVRLHRPRADDELSRDVAARPPRHRQIEDLALPRCEPIEWPLAPAHPGGNGAG